MKDQKKTKGKARIETMLRQQRPMTIYTVKKEDCPEFARQAKSYGILYAPIPIKKGDDTIDILVFEDDAGRANRIVEKFKLVAENTASIKSEIEKSRESRGSEQAPPSSLPRKRARKISWWTKCWKNPRKKKRGQPENPAAEKADSFSKAAEKSPPSAPTSENSSRHAEGTSNPPKKSVREELREIQAARKQEAELPHEEKTAPAKKAAAENHHP